jgi:hypothetical protein
MGRSRLRVLRIALIVCFFVLAGCGYYHLKSKLAPFSTPSLTSHPSPEDFLERQHLPNPAGNPSNWKLFVSTRFDFEILYPGDWRFNSAHGGGLAANDSGYAGQLENLFDLEKDGPAQAEEWGDFIDGALVAVQITSTTPHIGGTSPGVRDRAKSASTTLEQWVENQVSLVGADKVEDAPISTNGFIGSVRVVYNRPDSSKPWGEAGGAYRIIPNGRAVLVSWQRMNVSNDISYQNYLIPMLSSFKLRQ